MGYTNKHCQLIRHKSKKPYNIAVYFSLESSLMPFFVLAILFCSSATFAASTSFEAFDFKNCLHWYVDSDVGGVSPPAYKAARILADRQPYSDLNRTVEWTDYEIGRTPFVYAAGAFTDATQDKFIEKFGVCYYQRAIKKPQFRCLPNQDFPFAGATYQEIKSKGQLQTFQCIKGCIGVPEFIHDMGYEPEEGETNIEAERAQSKFRKICKRQ